MKVKKKNVHHTWDPGKGRGKKTYLRTYSIRAIHLKRNEKKWQPKRERNNLRSKSNPQGIEYENTHRFGLRFVFLYLFALCPFWKIGWFWRAISPHYYDFWFFYLFPLIFCYPYMFGKLFSNKEKLSEGSLLPPSSFHPSVTYFYVPSFYFLFSVVKPLWLL